MKKTFRMAAVLVALAAFVMASCQNAAGGGGGGGVTPTPTPPEPETESVEGEEYKFVGSYDLDTYTKLVLKEDRTGAFVFNTPSASTRSVALDDVKFTWGFADLPLTDVCIDDGTAAPDYSKARKVNLKYLKFVLPEDENIKIDGNIAAVKYKKVVKGDGTADTAEEDTVNVPENGVLVGVNGVNFSSVVIDQSKLTVGGVTVASLPATLKEVSIEDGLEAGLNASFTVNNVEMKDSSGTFTAKAPKIADLSGVFALYTEEYSEEEGGATAWAMAQLMDAYDAVNGYDNTDPKAPDKYKSDADAVTFVFLPTTIDVKAGGAADVEIVIFDGAEITDTFNAKTIELEFGSSSASKKVTVTSVKRINDEGGKSTGYATGVIADCKVEIVNKKITLAKLVDNATSPTEYIELFKYDDTGTGEKDLTANVPFLSITKVFESAKDSSGPISPLGNRTKVEDASIDVLYRKVAVTN